MRDHGGDLDRAMTRYGGTDWIDLSTGINRVPYPVPPLPASAWTNLPTRTAQTALATAAQKAWNAAMPLLPLAGAQAAIQTLPRLGRIGTARVLGPTYNEHAANLRAAGWAVTEVGALGALNGADLAVVVNPNNPDGRSWSPDALRALDVGRLIVDESFADPFPGLSLLALPPERGRIILRSFGKFYGLAGLRLGFAAGHPEDLAQISAVAGPWPVSGAALEIGRIALADRSWAEETTARLHADATRMDAAVPWPLVGGTPLFRLYDTPDATAAQHHLARHGIWSRIFPYSSRWIRLGLPAPLEWPRVEAALSGQ
ncbi:threonine-phosphate decarboxylase [Falsirhodobacter sp. alg1]|uniref:threonine-phosphate decarboxylase n=1 Tax=Falsirhodobacter sp. alg1 TaxID=1472418 RepID=UPI0005EE947C|nr:threonine-phosphate decarboxylase [Falsirhodobacter sp. alg1]